jgi:hypothetical protein
MKEEEAVRSVHLLPTGIKGVVMLGAEAEERSPTLSVADGIDWPPLLRPAFQVLMAHSATGHP